MSHQRHLITLVGAGLLGLTTLAGCASPTTSAETSDAPTASASATPNCTTQIGSTTRELIPGYYRITDTVDGDTLRVQRINADCSMAPEETVRLLGINAPEVAHGSNGTDECGGPQAKARMENLADNTLMVKLIPDKNSAATDKYSRTLAYVESYDPELPAATEDFGASMVEDGYAAPWAPSGVTHPTRMAHYEQLWSTAVAEKRGNAGGCPIDQLEKHG